VSRDEQLVDVLGPTDGECGHCSVSSCRVEQCLERRERARAREYQGGTRPSAGPTLGSGGQLGRQSEGRRATMGTADGVPDR
jgi:hypothetical protein